VPLTSIASRKGFIIDGLLSTFKFFLYADLAQTYFQANPLFQGRTDRDPAVSITDQGIWWQAISVWCFWLSAYGAISMQYTLLSIVTVALGISEPVDWPPVFGSFSDAYTIRRAWGYVNCIFSGCA
jgi:hypothetical protein